MKKTLAFVAAFMCASAFAQGLPVSASYEAPVSASTVATDDVSAPSVAAMGCCTVSAPGGLVSSPVSMSYDGRVSTPQADEGSDSLAMAGLGFGLFGLVGVTKYARRKKQKGTETM